MYIYRPGAKFYITFILVTLIPTVWFVGLFQNLIGNSSIQLIKQLASLGLIQAPATVTLIGCLFWIYESYLWHIWPLSYLHKLPYIAGRYKGEVESSFDGNRYSIVLEVRQTLLDVNICLYTPRSSSFSIIAAVGENEHGNQFLAYAYKNTPRTVSNDLDMRPHDGFASLEIFQMEHKLDGFYFNDPRERGRHGKLSCTFEGSGMKGHY